MSGSSRSRDPARDVWLDRSGRDAERCRAHAALAREYADTVEAIAKAVTAGSIELGRRSRKLLRRLELAAETFAEIATADEAIAELLDACEGYDADVLADRWPPLDHPRRSKVEARRAGVHLVARDVKTGNKDATR